MLFSLQIKNFFPRKNHFIAHRICKIEKIPSSQKKATFACQSHYQKKAKWKKKAKELLFIAIHVSLHLLARFCSRSGWKTQKLRQESNKEPNKKKTKKKKQKKVLSRSTKYD